MSSLSITTEDDDEVVFPSPVGEMIRLDFLEPLQIIPDALAEKLQLDAALFRDVIEGRRPLDVETDLKLGRYFGISAGFFLHYQNDQQVRVERYRLASVLDSIKPRQAEAAVAAE